MTKKTTQKSKSGDNSTTVQAETVNIQYGLSEERATNLFSELWDKNHVELVTIAENAAKAGVEKLAKEFFSQADGKLTKEDISKLSDPDVQVMINQASNSAGRKDSDTLRADLSSLLVGRIKNHGDDLKVILYDEAISTVAKLTDNQLKILTIVFVLFHTSNSGINNWEGFNRFINEYLKPFLDFEGTQTDFQHLVYAGCASLSTIGEKDLGRILLHTYPFLFAKLIPQNEIDALDLAGIKNSLFLFNEEEGQGFYIPKMTIMLDNLEENLINAAGVKPDVSKKVTAVYKKHLKGTGEVLKDLKEKTDMGEKLANVINNKQIRRLTLTSVGIVIAASHYEQVTGSALDIDIWIKK